MAVNYQAMYVLTSGSGRRFEKLENNSNNLANVNTPGFKKVLYREMSQKLPQNEGKTGDLFVFPRYQDSFVLLKQGTLHRTSQDLDFAIDGDGFFQIQTDKGTMLTRNGRFKYDSQGYLIDQNGGYVLSEGGNKIKVDTMKPVSVTKDGKIYQNGEFIAKISVVNFDKVKPLGTSYYQPTGNPAEAKYTVRQGYLEDSNLSAVEAMIDLIDSQRMFNMNGTLLRALDQLEQRSHEIGKA